nr:hypothetical protein [Tanacetum cinerariifolium]GFB43895.1 hypothetical protein [Tanacetum cinerariifolium]
MVMHVPKQILMQDKLERRQFLVHNMYCCHYWLLILKVQRAQKLRLLMMLERKLLKFQERRMKFRIQQKKVANTNSTNRLNTVSSPVNTVSSPVNAVNSFFTTMDPGRERAQKSEFESMFGQDKDANGNKIFTPVSAAGSTYDTGIFSGVYDDEVEGVEADFNNLELTTVVCPIPTTKIHKDHPKEQIIGDSLLALQTKRMTKTSQEHAMRLVDLPKGKHAIGTKWVYRNKKDERGVVVRNKARLVGHGYTKEEGIDYDEVFTPFARIETI